MINARVDILIQAYRFIKKEEKERKMEINQISKFSSASHLTSQVDVKLGCEDNLIIFIKWRTVMNGCQSGVLKEEK